MLAFGVFVAIRSGNAESAGNVVAIFLLTPLLMSPIGSLSAYIVMAGSAWPRIETVNKMLESRASREESFRHGQGGFSVADSRRGKHHLFL